MLIEASPVLPGLVLTFALTSACLLQVQHVHAILAGASGSMQRAALADLRHDYEADYRYTGKV